MSRIATRMFVFNVDLPTCHALSFPFVGRSGNAVLARDQIILRRAVIYIACDARDRRALKYLYLAVNQCVIHTLDVGNSTVKALDRNDPVYIVKQRSALAVVEEHYSLVDYAVAVKNIVHKDTEISTCGKAGFFGNIFVNADVFN